LFSKAFPPTGRCGSASPLGARDTTGAQAHLCLVKWCKLVRVLHSECVLHVLSVSVPAVAEWVD
jgi:hypothetical protein